MAKSPTQRSREHVARLRRKAQAFDLLIAQLTVITAVSPTLVDAKTIKDFVQRAEKATQEVSA